MNTTKRQTATHIQYNVTRENNNTGNAANAKKITHLQTKYTNMHLQQAYTSVSAADQRFTAVRIVQRENKL